VSLRLADRALVRRVPAWVWLLLGAGLVAVLIGLAREGGGLTPAKAIVLGLVEGVTEFLPVSSTGHLTVTQDLLGVGTATAQEKEAADAYAVVIQAGAILAVVVLYRHRIVSIFNGLLGRDPVGRRVLVGLVVAFLPAAVVGVVLESAIKKHLFGVGPVVAAWAVGGVVLLALSRRGFWETGDEDPGAEAEVGEVADDDPPRRLRGRPLEAITVRSALIIGVAQILALWPGTSRSLVTIVAGLLVGLNLAAAVEFSFLLGLATLGAATALDAVKFGPDIVDVYGWQDPLLGFVVAFLAAVVAVRWMVTYLQRHSLAIFGWYRLGVAALVGVLLVAGVV
jgi:undecaprenyl-diphosphatase